MSRPPHGIYRSRAPIYLGALCFVKLAYTNGITYLGDLCGFACVARLRCKPPIDHGSMPLVGIRKPFGVSP